MSIPVRQRYEFPFQREGRLAAGILRNDFFLAISCAENIVAKAKQEVQRLYQEMEKAKSDNYEKIQLELDNCKTEAALAAQREVWQSNLKEWLAFNHALSERRAALDVSLYELLMIVLDRLKLNLSSREKLESSIALILNEKLGVQSGIIKVSPDGATIVQKLLTDYEREDIVVEVDSLLAEGVCILQCGQLSFSTNFDGNIQTIANILESALEKAPL